MDIGCSCICSYDGEAPDVSNTTWPKARKEHECCECGEAIEPGQRYERTSGLWDGFWDTFKTCRACVRIRADVCCGGFVYGELRELISEEFGFDYVTGECPEDEEG